MNFEGCGADLTWRLHVLDGGSWRYVGDCQGDVGYGIESARLLTARSPGGRAVNPLFEIVALPDKLSVRRLAA